MTELFREIPNLLIDAATTIPSMIYYPVAETAKTIPKMIYYPVADGIPLISVLCVGITSVSLAALTLFDSDETKTNETSFLSNLPFFNNSTGADTTQQQPSAAESVYFDNSTEKRMGGNKRRKRTGKS